jgi:putative glycosyl hydrolase-like family 13 (GHL13) protein
VYLPIDGVLFDDDAFMLPGERLRGGAAADPRAKAEAIERLLAEIKAGVRAWRPGCKFGRTLYAPVVERGGVHPDFAQDLGRSLQTYDLTVVVADARWAGHRSDAASWVRRLAAKAARRWVPPSWRTTEPPPLALPLASS